MKTNDTAPRITHFTENTGDSQSFSLTPSNFDPAAVKSTLLMFDSEIHGFQLSLVKNNDPHMFAVDYNGRMVSLNVWDRNAAGNIELGTTLHHNAASLDPETAMMMADLEQCAAIALANHGAPMATKKA